MPISIHDKDQCANCEFLLEKLTGTPGRESATVTLSYLVIAAMWQTKTSRQATIHDLGASPALGSERLKRINFYDQDISAKAWNNYESKKGMDVTRPPKREKSLDEAVKSI